jgi:hypothetical protein
MHANVTIIGTGVVGNAKLADDTMGYLDSFNFNPIKLSTSLAIEKFNQETSTGKRVAAFIHITC